MNTVFTILVAAVLTMSSLAEGQCPTSETDLTIQTNMCKIKPEFFNGVALGIDKEKAEKACKNDAYKGPLSCLQKLYDACIDNTYMTGLMERLSNFTRLSEDFEYICSHLPVLSDNAQCIANANQIITPCINAETKSFLEEHASGTVDIQETCDFSDNIVECSNDAYADQACGDDVNNVMKHAISITVPVVCASWSTTANTSAIMLLAIIASLFMKS